MTLLVTGGAGFIGSNFVKYIVETHREPVVVLDNLTYAGDRNNLPKSDMISFHEGEIGDYHFVSELLRRYNPRGIINFAAESHVDRSIDCAAAFTYTNVVATVTLLEAARDYIYSFAQDHLPKPDFRFHHISTDEVYGSLGPNDPPFTETTPYAPRSPYAASKAASDHFVAAFGNTYGLPYVITNCSNNYGPRQHKEKFIPTVITKLLAKEPIPLYGDGSNIRDWIYVMDHCEAIYKVFVYAQNNSKYNIGGKCQVTNLQMIEGISKIMGIEPIIKYVPDRLGHDFRYDIDNTKIEHAIHWYPNTHLGNGLIETIKWYTDENIRNNSSGR
jgi:dTDP-glucose 4,6-dehydratase